MSRSAQFSLLIIVGALAPLDGGCSGGDDGMASQGQAGAIATSGAAGASAAGAAGAAGGSDTGGSNGGGAAGSAGGNSGGAPGGAGATGAGAGGSGEPGMVTPLDLFPLAVGNEWTYAHDRPVSGCPDGVNVVQVLSNETFEGREAFQLVDSCYPELPPAQLSVTDDGIEQWVNEEWQVGLAAPIQAGFQWNFFAVMYEWVEVETVTVAAGTFLNCWQRLGTPSTTRTYCPGVGFVEDGADAHELTAFSVN